MLSPASLLCTRVVLFSLSGTMPGRAGSLPCVPLSPSVSASSHSHLRPPFCTRMDRLLTHSSLSPFRILPLKFSEFPHPSVCPSPFPGPKSSTLHSVLRTSFLNHLLLHSLSTPVYTDGYRTSAGVRFAILFPSCYYQYSLPSVASIFTAELYAIYFAVSFMFSFPSSSFTFFCDSRSALLLLQSFPAVHPLVLATQEWLFRLSVQKKVVQFYWVPSHVGVRGNEQVDGLARDATTARSASLSIPASDYYPAFFAFLMSRWQTMWSSVSSNKLHTIKSPVSAWASPSHRVRRWETALARFRIGHTRFTHSFLMSRSPPLCSRCRVQLSVSHILLDCPLYSLARLRYFSFLSMCRRPPCLADILSESASFSVDQVMSFVLHLRLLNDI